MSLIDFMQMIKSLSGISEFVFLGLAVFSFFYFLSLRKKDKELDLVRKSQDIMDKNFDTVDFYRERLETCEERNERLEEENDLLEKENRELRRKLT